MANGYVDGVVHDLSVLFSSLGRDFLIDNNSDKVKISSLNGKMVWLYFSHSEEVYGTFYKELLEVYEEASSKGDFEVVLVDNYDDEDESFKSYFSKMPWLAIPFSDSDTRNRLMQLSTYPSLIIFNSNGNVTTFLGNYIVPISELEGKTVGLYFSPTDEGYLIPTIDVYNEMKGKGENFEIVSIDYPRDEEFLKQEYKKISWLSMPFTESNTKKLVRIFINSSLNAYGIDAFPFNPNMLDELANSWKAKQETQTLKSLLVYEDKDFSIAKSGYKVPVADLIGKTIMFYILYADDYICSRNFTQKLFETYHDIKAKDDAFEVIFILMEGDEDIFDEFFSNMPWLAVPGAIAYPFTEQHLKHLEEEMEETVKGWPKKLKHGLCLEHEFSLKWQLDARLCQECRTFDQFVCRHYYCDACNDLGIGWCFACKPCHGHIALHPKCAFEGAS
ncbi:hypothetical protein UlMin_044869 [Ulmus minor]